MDRVKIEKVKIGDVLQDNKGVRYLVTKINWGESWFMAIDSHFRNLLITHDYAKVFLYYVESLDIKKVISPDKDISERYERRYAKFRKIYPALKNTFADMITEE